jgi:hypothetical protein
MACNGFPGMSFDSVAESFINAAMSTLGSLNLNPAGRGAILPPFIVTLLGVLFLGAATAAAAEARTVTYEQYLREGAVSRALIERFLRGPSWAKFDPELGYILGNFMPADGMDGSATISTSRSDGTRTSFVYADRACRINTYGNSFTLCHQVSDAETWQEYLAGHLGEPIRNFGMGGYGVYQSYRRMLREEKTGRAAGHLIFYIWGDDHFRSLLRCRHASFYRQWDDKGGSMFHNNFWPNVEMNLETGAWEEHENRLPTPESLVRMTEPEWLVANLKDDLALQLSAYKSGYIDGLDPERVTRLAVHLNTSVTWDDQAALRAQAGALLDRYSLAATRFILDKARAFAAQNGKKLMVVLFDPYRAMEEMRTRGTRYDQEIVDYLEREKVSYFDMNEVHLRDFKNYNLTFGQYRKLYFIGHYNPRGNHFFAYAIKDRIVDWLEPKPVTYQQPDEQAVRFQGYLENLR